MVVHHASWPLPIFWAGLALALAVARPLRPQGLARDAPRRSVAAEGAGGATRLRRPAEAGDRRLGRGTGCEILKLRLTVWAPVRSNFTQPSATNERRTVDILPDLGSLSDAELKQLKDDLEAQEHELSYQRRILHGKIDILRAELVARLKQSGGRSVLDEVDVARLTDILAEKSTPGE